MSDNVSVLVTEGRVAVDQAVGTTAGAATGETKQAGATPHHEPLATLVAGKSVSVPTHPNRQRDIEVETVPEPVAQQRLAWRIPRLEFTITPLREVITVFNRHNRIQFVIADSALEQLPLSGVLRADRVDALVEMLEAEFDIKALREGGQILLRK
jgi:transmembrane sensor